MLVEQVRSPVEGSSTAKNLNTGARAPIALTRQLDLTDGQWVRPSRFQTVLDGISVPAHDPQSPGRQGLQLPRQPRLLGAAGTRRKDSVRFFVHRLTDGNDR
ncbi:hypothetical protein FHX37_1618 [Haloactinospora alba]|uniref:Uncharacterized protein n=1 Tax=Haloactinospora alba TaxID=405555 RepID=A0A543NIM8_9ACTN|nr:hypothetical protein FHX37_1618 [Haloactinospora alba]